MIAGVVMFALGVKKVLEHTGDPLKEMPAVALCGGLALYALAHVAFRVRSMGTFGPPRLLVAIACAALIPLALGSAGITTLLALAVVWIALIAYETVQFAEQRARVRAGQHASGAREAAPH